MAEHESLFSLRPVPGTEEARGKRCLCPWGGLWQRVVDSGCPLHGPMVANNVSRSVRPQGANPAGLS